jgi:curved DNA-binding protein
MPVDFKDYYQILGVDKKATGAEIKKAFRKLARKFHPDVAKDKTTADGRFSEISEANEVLSDPDKRKRYDELGAQWNQPGGQQGEQSGRYAGNGGHDPEFHYDGTGFSDFFDQFLGSHGRASAGFGHFGRPEEHGRGGTAFPRNGRDRESDILVTLDEVLHGSTRTLRLQRNDPHSGKPGVQTLQVKIPPGTREGQLIRLAGKGEEGVAGGNSGNLFLRVVLAIHPDFRVRDFDLYYDLHLAAWEAVLGTTVQIETLDKAVSLKIPAGTAAGRKFRLKGKGLPGDDGTRGNLFAIVAIEVPVQLTTEEKTLWESLANTSTFNPRTMAS